MLRTAKACVVALTLVGMSLAHAAPTPTQNGYFASAKWREMGSWPHVYWTQTVGPYLTYADCYTDWTQMTHNPPSGYWLESTVPCHLVSTHMAYKEVSLMINDDGDDETGPTVFDSLEEIVDYVDEIGELRRQYNIDDFEAAVERLR